MVDIHLIADGVIAAVHARMDVEIGEQRALGLAREFLYSALPLIRNEVGDLDPAAMNADDLLDVAQFMLTIDPDRTARRNVSGWTADAASLN